MHPDIAEIGRQAEEKAAEFLERSGWRIMARRYHCFGGEIDLIAVKEGRSRDEDHLAFVEVKYRRNCRMGRPAEAVDYRKQRRLAYTAGRFLAGQQWQGTLSFDIMEVSGAAMEHIVHIPNAFCPPGFYG